MHVHFNGRKQTNMSIGLDISVPGARKTRGTLEGDTGKIAKQPDQESAHHDKGFFYSEMAHHGIVLSKEMT